MQDISNARPDDRGKRRQAWGGGPQTEIAGSDQVNAGSRE
jgi:hypothetical protein